MHTTDSKIRLFFELTYQKDVQITSYIPLKNYSISWKPEKMYTYPDHQYYYVFINDPELISKIKEGETKGQEYLYKLSKYLEKSPDFQGNDFLIEFNANNIIDNSKKNPNVDQYVIFTRISIDNFSFINDYKTASKAYLLERNKPLIYANKGRIKELLIGEKVKENKINEENNLNNSFQSNKDDKKDEDNEEKINSKKQKNKELLLKQIPGNWFLVNMNNLNFVKKDKYDDFNKQKIIKFLSIIKYREVTPLEPDPNNLQEQNSIQNNQNLNITNKNDDNSSEEKEEVKDFVIDTKYQQPQEFAFRQNENSKLITVYQPKSCREHLKKNDFWCKTCNQLCCLECIAGSVNSNINDDNINIHKNHKIHLLEEIISKTEEDANALEERIKNLLKIIDGEISKKQDEIRNLKEENEKMVKMIQSLYDENNSLIRQEELKRTKELAALVNEILRINEENNKRINYLNKLFEHRTMNEYLNNYFIYKNIFVEETKNNLAVLERKVIELINYYKKK